MPGTIKDPRMNPKNEEDFGIVFMPDPFTLPNPPETYPPGHYFYYKTINNESGHSVFNNSRFYPHGFPVQAVKKHPHAPKGLADENKIPYENIYCNLNRDISLIVDLKLEAGETLNDDYPMASYLHKAISHDSGTDRWGLKNVNKGNSYHHIDTGPIGKLQE